MELKLWVNLDSGLFFTHFSLCGPMDKVSAPRFEDELFCDCTTTDGNG